jgi:VanZ family protein
MLRFALAVVYAVAVFWGGVIDVGPLPKLPEVPTDKVLHALVFLGLELVLELALVELQGWRRRAAAVLGSIVIGGLLELVQSALPYRSADVLDWAADALGAAVGALLSVLASRWFLRGAGRAAADAR